ncbi:MAG: aminotransferase class V-fold PLP-dependent enzyme [Treponema sp.]|nr:aminotransferase class V-fold PLP-dependent enzyme [Treponema sp.]
MEKRIFFDHAAGAFGNPSSQHNEGRIAKIALEDARKRCANALDVAPETLYFTSGGTESNSIALFSTLTRPGKGRVISSLAEHASVREGMQTLERLGKTTGVITVDSAGRVTPDTLTKALNQYGDVRFISAMHVNNETGAVTDIMSLRDVIKKYTDAGKPHIHFHCDLVQAAGKIPVDIKSFDIDSASISAHKLGGPRGIGLLYFKKPVEVFFSGGGQESGIRGGTENVQGAVGLADCLEEGLGKKLGFDKKAGLDKKADAKARWQKLIGALADVKRCTLIPYERNLDFDNFSPYILQAAFKDIPGEVMARALDDLGFAVSTGSACSSSSPERPVLVAMGVSENLRIEGIRISQGYSTTNEDIDALLCGIKEVLKFL